MSVRAPTVNHSHVTRDNYKQTACQAVRSER